MGKTYVTTNPVEKNRTFIGKKEKKNILCKNCDVQQNVKISLKLSSTIKLFISSCIRRTRLSLKDKIVQRSYHTVLQVLPPITLMFTRKLEPIT